MQLLHRKLICHGYTLKNSDYIILTILPLSTNLKLHQNTKLVWQHQFYIGHIHLSFVLCWASPISAILLLFMMNKLFTLLKYCHNNRVLPVITPSYQGIVLVLNFCILMIISGFSNYNSYNIILLFLPISRQWSLQRTYEVLNLQIHGLTMTAKRHAMEKGEAGEGIYILNNLTFTQMYPFKDERRN